MKKAARQTTFQDAIAGFEATSALPDDVREFYQGIVLTGDILVLPPGMIMVEKAVNSHSLGIRTTFHMIHDAGVSPGFDIARDMMPQ